jgi:hypothetical protein
MDRIVAMSEQLIGCIMKEILDPKGEFYNAAISIENLHRRRDISTTCNRDIDNCSLYF